MSKQYKIVRNKPPLSATEIDRHKNFNKTLENYRKLHNYKQATRPLYKDKKLLGLVMLLAIVFLAVWISDQKEEKAPEHVQKDTITISPTHLEKQ